MTKDEQYYKDLDKRTKEFKEWKASQNIEPHKEAEPSQGLGDTIEKVFKATGIDKVVKFIAGEDCGCDERKKKLNEMFSYRQKPKCLIESEYEILHTFFESNPKQIKPSDQRDLNTIHKRVFGYEEGTCDGCVRAMVNKLKTVYEAY